MQLEKGAHAVSLSTKEDKRIYGVSGSGQNMRNRKLHCYVSIVGVVCRQNLNGGCLRTAGIGKEGSRGK